MRDEDAADEVEEAEDADEDDRHNRTHDDTNNNCTCQREYKTRKGVSINIYILHRLQLELERMPARDRARKNATALCGLAIDRVYKVSDICMHL